jgi:CheY-like chemotaxis protein
MTTQRARVLVVDDEPDILEQIKEILEGQYDVAVARTFEEALAAFEARPPDVAVLDIMGVNGEELLKRFRKTAPCVMLTAHALTPQHLKRTAAAGARLYLPKDELVRLGEYVQKVLDNPRKSLWGWLMKRLDFSRWFGLDWQFVGDAFPTNLTIEEIERDLRAQDE